MSFFRNWKNKGLGFPDLAVLMPSIYSAQYKQKGSECQSEIYMLHFSNVTNTAEVYQGIPADQKIDV